MKNQSDRRLWVGFLFLAAGLFLLLKYFGTLPWQFPDYLISWKTLLIFLGIVFMVSSKNKSTGIILFLIGSAFLATDVFGISIRELLKIAIPSALIVAGLAIILKRNNYSPKQINIPEGDNPNDYINDVNIFSGGEKKVSSENFKGGQITAIFGGAEVDLRAAKMAEGINAIDLLCIFGGTSLKLPEGWVVKSDVTAVFGGYSDERMPYNKDEKTDSDKTLHMKGLVLFGGCEIK